VGGGEIEALTREIVWQMLVFCTAYQVRARPDLNLLALERAATTVGKGVLNIEEVNSMKAGNFNNIWS
jgi:hypothetical protein